MTRADTLRRMARGRAGVTPHVHDPLMRSYTGWTLALNGSTIGLHGGGFQFGSGSGAVGAVATTRVGLTVGMTYAVAVNVIRVGRGVPGTGIRVDVRRVSDGSIAATVNIYVGAGQPVNVTRTTPNFTADGPVDLILTDISLPGNGGSTDVLVRRVDILSGLHPDIRLADPTLYSSTGWTTVANGSNVVFGQYSDRMANFGSGGPSIGASIWQTVTATVFKPFRVRWSAQRNGGNALLVPNVSLRLAITDNANGAVVWDDSINVGDRGRTGTFPNCEEHVSPPLIAPGNMKVTVTDTSAATGQTAVGTDIALTRLDFIPI